MDTLPLPTDRLPDPQPSSPTDDSSSHFILSPVTGEADVEVNKLASGLDSPMLKLFPRLSNIHLSLDEEQYKTLLQSVDWFAQTQVLKQNLKYRPHRRISDGEDPRLWWNYAITAIRQVVRDREEQYTWNYILRRRETKVAYMRLFAKRELKVATPVESQTLEQMEKELSVNDIKWFRTLTRRYLQMLRHEKENDEDSDVKKDAWKLVRQHLGDFATKDLDTQPSSGGWLSMLSWGGGSAKKEDPRWEETAGEVGYVMGWQNGEEDIEPHSPPEVNVSSPEDLDGPNEPKKSIEKITTRDRFSTDSTRSIRSREEEKLSPTPQPYSIVAAKPFQFGIEHISPYPFNADTFLLVDVRLLRGSLTLRRGQHQGINANKTITAISFNGFRPIFKIFTQPSEPNAPPTWDFTSTLARLLVTDESNPASKFKKIVQAPRPKDDRDGSASVLDFNDDTTSELDFDAPDLWDEPLLLLNAAQLSPKTGYNKRVEIRLEESLIFYHRQFVEEIVRFFRPPDKHETLNALFDAMMEATKEYATETMDKIRTADGPLTRSALEFAITETKANVIEMHLKAPLIIFPEESNPLVRYGRLTN